MLGIPLLFSQTMKLVGHYGPNYLDEDQEITDIQDQIIATAYMMYKSIMYKISTNLEFFKEELW